jgi:hypothetical protein
MLLSNQMFDRIVGLSGPDDPDGQRKATVLPAGCRRAAERRSTTRLAFGHRSQICCDNGPKAGRWETVMLQDISSQGIGCLCQEPRETGTTFVIKLTDKEGETIRIRCRVRRCERGGFGNTAFMVGATFEQVIQQLQLRVNDDVGDARCWQDSADPSVELASLGRATVGVRSGGSAVSRVAAHLFKVVDPFRAASQWMRRFDDFS